MSLDNLLDPLILVFWSFPETDWWLRVAIFGADTDIKK